MGTAWTGSSGGVAWRLELERDRLLPGRLTLGRVTVTANRAVDARALVVTLRGEEHWRYTTSNGKTTTIRRGHEDLPPVAVTVSGPLTLLAGRPYTYELSLPVPSLGPATLEATEAGVTWSVEAKLDIPGGMDSSIEVPVRVLQPTALLRAGVVHVGEFALYEGADARAGGVTGSITLDPVPLVAGERFAGRLVLRPQEPMDLQEIRVEVRVEVRATVSSGRVEILTPFSATVAGPTHLDGERVVEFTGVLGDRALPTIELPHGRASAEVHVILARALRMDPHLERDVAIATTSEL